MHSGRAAELGSKGGRRRAVYDLAEIKDIRAPKNAAELRDLLAQSIVEVRIGKMDPKTPNAINCLGTGMLRAIEVAEGAAERANAGIGRPQLAFEVFEAQWLRDKKARWAAELEEKYADQFPPGEPPGGVSLACLKQG